MQHTTIGLIILTDFGRNSLNPVITQNLNMLSQKVSFGSSRLTSFILQRIPIVATWALLHFQQDTINSNNNSRHCICTQALAPYSQCWSIPVTSEADRQQKLWQCYSGWLLCVCLSWHLQMLLSWFFSAEKKAKFIPWNSEVFPIRIASFW